MAAGTRPGTAAPVIVLGYPYSGAARLQSLLSDNMGLACTAGTGVLPLCHQAADVWRRAEGRGNEPGKISALAAASIRAMVGTMITRMLAGGGRDRWCELAVASEDVAETFLGLYPATRFLCLHRSLGGMARDSLQASPWGLAGPGYAPFLAAHPGSTFSALAAFWVAHTTVLLAFENGHQANCLRIHYEDIAERAGTGATIASFLGISTAGSVGINAAAGWPMQSAEHVSRIRALPRPASTAVEQHDMPINQLSPQLLAEANTLLARLGYPQLSRG